MEKKKAAGKKKVNPEEAVDGRKSEELLTKVRISSGGKRQGNLIAFSHLKRSGDTKTQEIVVALYKADANLLAGIQLNAAFQN